MSIEIFFYYSANPEDEKLRKELTKQLNLIKDKRVINYYYSRDISAGTDKKKIEERLKSANMVVVLISPDLWDLEKAQNDPSEEDYQQLQQQIIEKHTQDAVPVIPVLLRPCEWYLGDFKNFQPLPKGKDASDDWRFVTTSGNLDQVLAEVAKGIIEAVQEISGLNEDKKLPKKIPGTQEKPQDESLNKRIKRRFKSIDWYGVRNVVTSSMSISFLVILVRFLGVIEPSELWLFDNMMRFKPPEDPDKNILIIQVTPEDIRKQGSEQRQGSLTDATLFKILNTLLNNSQNIRPKVIGLDIHRDFETNKDTGLSKLLIDNKNNNIFGVCYVGDKTQQNPDGIKPPPEFINQRLGFSDLLPDKDSIVRRHLLIMDKSLNSSFCRSKPDNVPITNAFSLELALHFLNQSENPLLNNERSLKIGNTLFNSIYADYRGGYSMSTDLNGYQILLNYRISCINGDTCSPENAAKKVSIADVSQPDFIERYKDFVKDKIVLIGVTDSTYEAPWTTPLYSKSHRQIPGVIIQAQMVSQIISAVSDKRPLLQVWSIWSEMSWIFAWSLIGGTFFQIYRRNQKLTALGIIIFFSLPLGCYVMFIFTMFWIPCIPPILSFSSTGIMVLFLKLRLANSQKSS
ncbi:CHASE2 domain-containing protein [Nostoc sp. KVJ3]|uniref:CHASE2 domain-containing protein n=1 Tax=Nostoc sp. KVJ3 TaxID=457945 RepID=UPI0022376E56|nr:CHASE2 domain-containing protein [Nostoc sp. KVJ3]MCW5312852.1 CHASE2 domain-containing protein [Nostoc sp. KVJ3]